MKVILLEDVGKIGKQYETHEVKPGFARNMLFPANRAVPATKENIKRYEALRAKKEKEKALNEELLEKSLDSLKDTVLLIHKKANSEGHLFESVGKNDVVEALHNQKRITLSPDVVVLPKPIKTVGEHTIPLRIKDKEGMITLSIVPQQD